MRDAFSLFDEDKDGLLDYHELKVSGIYAKECLMRRRWRCVRWDST